MDDEINKAPHYNQHPSGVECIDIIEDMPFCLANAFKYVFRADHKGQKANDLKKAAYYVARQISLHKNQEKWAIYPKEKTLSISSHGRVKNNETGNIRTLVPIKNGYLTFLHKKKLRYVHKCVLETFVGDCPKGWVCAHRNGNKKNNFLYNLRWTTYKQNTRDNKKNGTSKHGSRNPSSKLSDEKVDKIKNLKGSLSTHKCAEMFGISASTVSRIWRGVAWNDATPKIVKFFEFEKNKVLHLIWSYYVYTEFKDLKKARYYIDREIEKIENEQV